jgi:hypothetical protein
MAKNGGNLEEQTLTQRYSPPETLQTCMTLRRVQRVVGRIRKNPSAKPQH